METYQEEYRKHMQYELEREAKEWHKLNVKRKGWLRAFWDDYSESIRLFLWMVAGILFFSICVFALNAAEAVKR